MARKQKQTPSRLFSGMPLTPWIFVHNSINNSTIYADALSSLIPQSFVGTSGESITPLPERTNLPGLPIWAHFATCPYEAADIARRCQIKALEQGRNMASLVLCNNSNMMKYLAVDKAKWPENHTFIKVDDVPVEEVGRKIIRWLFTVLSVRETLHLIPKSEMLAIDTTSYIDYKYCALKETSKYRKDDKLQFVVLIASKPEVTEPNKLTWKVVDRSGEANFYFYHRGPASQPTWDWLLSLKVGDRKVHARKPMFTTKEPVAKTILLSPLRVTGTTIRGVGQVTTSVGMGVQWIGEKVSMKRALVSEKDWQTQKEEKERRREDGLKKKLEKTEQKRNRRRSWIGAIKVLNSRPKEKEKDAEIKGSDFKVFNEKGGKMWQEDRVEDDGSSTVAGSLVDEKVEKEFC